MINNLISSSLFLCISDGTPLDLECIIHLYITNLHESNFNTENFKRLVILFSELEDCSLRFQYTETFDFSLLGIF